MSAFDLVRDEGQRADFTARVAHLYREAHRRQGPRALEFTRRAAALHEAGHAVAFQATADGVRWWPPYRLRIWREPAAALAWLGETEVSPHAPPLRVTPDDLEGTLITAIRTAAGVVSERLFDGEDFRLASSADEQIMVGAMARNLEAHHWRLPAEQCLALLMEITADLLRRHAGAVHAVAGVLAQRRKLQGRELARLLAGVGRVALQTAPPE